MNRDGNRAGLHPAEHRAYRELYVASRQLINRWGRLTAALDGTPEAPVLEHGRDPGGALLAALGPRTAELRAARRADGARAGRAARGACAAPSPTAPWTPAW